jgi:hypothetical protein
MKKYLFGIFAIALAIGFSAFKKPFTNYQLKYIGATFTSSEVAKPANWTYDPNQTCSGIDEERPCTIVVAGSQFNTLNVPSSGLKSTTSIITKTSLSHAGDYVVDAGGNVVSFTNLDDIP